MTSTLSLTNHIRHAIHAGDVLTVIYHGKGEPTEPRLILPIGIDLEKGLVRAFCYEASGFRFFRLDKLAIVEDPPTDTHGD